MLAANIIETLLGQGYEVTGILRKGRKYPGLTTPALTIAEADFKNAAELRPLLEGCDGVIHVAAMTSQSCRDRDAYYRVNVEASENLLKLAEECGAKRFVYVSTANTIGFGKDETRPMCPPFSKSYYAQSKKEAEEALLGHAGSIELVIVNPTFMMGSYGSAKGSNRILSMVLKSPVLTAPPGGKNVLDVREAARGIILAMEGGTPGEKYLICGENYSYTRLFRTIAAHYGLRRFIIPVPGFLLSAAGLLGDFLIKCGLHVEFSSVNMRMLRVKNHYNTDKARRDFGFKAGRLFEGDARS